MNGIILVRRTGPAVLPALPALPVLLVLLVLLALLALLALPPGPASAQQPGVGPSASAQRPNAGPSTSEQRPNIVFVLADDHAAHALSAYRPHLDYGARLPDTPRLDSLAAEGILFADAFVTNSICAPSRAAILTGRYGHLTGVMTNAAPEHPLENTFPELLRAAGYETALFGKWHLQGDPPGFDRFEVLAGQGPYYNPVLRSADGERPHRGYTPDIITDRALRWLEGRGDAERPFLLLVHYNAAHRWWDPGPLELGLFRSSVIPEPATLFDDGAGRTSPAGEQEMEIARDLFDRDLKLEEPDNLDPAQLQAWREAYGPENRAFREMSLEGDALLRWRYQRYAADYLRTVAALDRNVGRLLDGLSDAGIEGETLVVYTSDQGFFVGDHGWFDKRWMYEESLRTPLLVRWPGVVEPGSVSRDLVMNLDLAQTLLDVAGAPDDPEMQGRSLVPILRGEVPDDWRDAVYYQYFAHPDWHMVHRQYGVRTARYKLIHFYETGEWELYDLERDPEELRSVHGHPAYREVETELRERLVELRRLYRVPERDPVPHTPFDPPPHLRRSGI